MSPRNDGPRPWDTTMTAISGRVEFAPEDLEKVRTLFPGKAEFDFET